jgi:hypothetical protein
MKVMEEENNVTQEQAPAVEAGEQKEEVQEAPASEPSVSEEQQN